MKFPLKLALVLMMISSVAFTLKSETKENVQQQEQQPQSSWLDRILDKIKEYTEKLKQTADTASQTVGSFNQTAQSFKDKWEPLSKLLLPSQTPAKP